MSSASRSTSSGWVMSSQRRRPQCLGRIARDAAERIVHLQQAAGHIDECHADRRVRKRALEGATCRTMPGEGFLAGRRIAVGQPEFRDTPLRRTVSRTRLRRSGSLSGLGFGAVSPPSGGYERGSGVR